MTPEVWPKANILHKRYANANRGVFLLLLPICDGMSKFMCNSMAFAFAFSPIGTWIDPLAAFAFGVMEAPQCV